LRISACASFIALEDACLHESPRIAQSQKLEAERKNRAILLQKRIAFLSEQLAVKIEEYERAKQKAQVQEAKTARRAPKKPLADDKLDLILKKLESLEKRISNLEKKGSSPEVDKR
jgi:hypothetical protein